MKNALLFATLILLSGTALAADSCTSAYNQCISSCCESCGSTLTYNSNGDLVCNAGTQDSPDEACISACSPCSTQYQQCIGDGNGAGSDQLADDLDKEISKVPGAESCCNSIFMILGVGALAGYSRFKKA